MQLKVFLFVALFMLLCHPFFLQLLYYVSHFSNVSLDAWKFYSFHLVTLKWIGFGDFWFGLNPIPDASKTKSQFNSWLKRDRLNEIVDQVKPIPWTKRGTRFDPNCNRIVQLKHVLKMSLILHTLVASRLLFSTSEEGGCFEKTSYLGV